MKFLPSPPKNFSFKARLILSIFLATAIPFSLFLVSGFLIDSDLWGKVRALPLLLFFVTAVGLAILLSQKVISSLQKLTKKIERIHLTDLSQKRAKDGLSLLNEYLDKMDEELKEKEYQIKRARNRFVALSAIATAVNQTLDLDRMLNQVLSTILEVTGFDGGMIFLLDEEGKNLTMRAWEGLQLDKICEFDQVKLGRRIVSETVKRKQIIFVPDTEDNQQWQTKEFKDKGAKTILTVPFVAKGKVFGVVVLISSKLKETSLEENEFLEAIGQQVGMAIDNINLLTGWTKKAHDLSLLLETSSTFSASLNLNQVLEILTQRMIKILDANFCYTALVDGGSKDMVFEIFAPDQPGASPIENPARGGIEKGERIRAEHLPLHHKVIQTGRMVKISQRDQLTASEKQLLPLDEESEVILMPLSIGARVLGMVGVGLRAAGKLNFENLKLCRSITSQAAIAVENARLYEDIKQKADEVSSLYQVAQRLSSILDWDELLDQILKVTVESFGYLNCAILLVDKRKKELFVKAASGFPDELIKNFRMKIGEEGITGWVAQTGEPLVVGDVSKDDRYIMGIKECKSEVAVPVKLKGEIIGVLDAESDKLFAFGEKDVRILSQLASQITVVLENSRLFSEERKRSMQVALINDVGRKVVSTLNLDKLLKTAIETIQLGFRYDHISLFLVEESSGDLILNTCCGKSCHAVKPGYRLKKGVGMVGRAAKSGKTTLCNDVAGEPTYIPAIDATRSELSVPIKSGKKIMGVLDVENFAKETFDEQDVAVLETLTDLLATAINNTKLYEETRRKAYRLELTDQINRAISSTLDLKSIFHVVSRELNKVIEYNRISLNFWHPEERLFEVKMSFCPDANLSPGNHKSIPADETNMYDVVQTKKPYYLAKLVLEPGSKPMDRLIFSEGMRSYILIPIIDNLKIIAILSLESKKEQGFSADQMELLESVGSHLSVAIQNARLFSDLQRAYQNLKGTQSRMIQIERFRAVGEMAGGVAHDFNNILASILGRVQLLLMKLKKEGASLPGEMVKSLQIIEKSATDGAKILSRLQEFTTAKPDTEFCPTDPNQLVEDSLKLTRTHWKDKALFSGRQIEVKTELKAKGRVLGDATELKEVLTNLILNAVDAMPKGGTLTLKTEEDEKSIFLIVEDTGVGMTEEVKNKIFVPFFTTKGKEGTGLGLSLAHRIITRHQGEITTESRPGSGSSFTIKLPRCDLVEEKQTPVKFKGESAHVLVVEDEKNIQEILEEILSTVGHRVTQAATGEEGVELFRKQKPDIVITDLGLPGMSGWDVAKKIKAFDPLTPVILSTGWGVKLGQIEEHKQNIDRIISKPFNMEQILNLISELLARRKTESVNA